MLLLLLTLLLLPLLLHRRPRRPNLVPAARYRVEDVDVLEDRRADAADDDERVGSQSGGGVAPAGGRRGAGGAQEVVEDWARGSQRGARGRWRKRKRKRKRERGGGSGAGTRGGGELGFVLAPTHPEALELPEEEGVPVSRFLLLLFFFFVGLAEAERAPRREARIVIGGLRGLRGRIALDDVAREEDLRLPRAAAHGARPRAGAGAVPRSFAREGLPLYGGVEAAPVDETVDACLRFGGKERRRKRGERGERERGVESPSKKGTEPRTSTWPPLPPHLEPERRQFDLRSRPPALRPFPLFDLRRRRLDRFVPCSMLWNRLPPRRLPSLAGLGRCDIGGATLTAAGVVFVAAVAGIALPSNRLRAAAAFATFGDSAASVLAVPSAGAYPTEWRSSPTIVE